MRERVQIVTQERDTLTALLKEAEMDMRCVKNARRFVTRKDSTRVHSC